MGDDAAGIVIAMALRDDVAMHLLGGGWIEAELIRQVGRFSQGNRQQEGVVVIIQSDSRALVEPVQERLAHYARRHGLDHHDDLARLRGFWHGDATLTWIAMTTSPVREFRSHARRIRRMLRRAGVTVVE